MTPTRAIRTGVVLGMVILASAPLWGATVITKSQQTFVGTIVEETAEAITLQTASGKVTIPKLAIAAIQRDTKPQQEKPKIVPAKILPAKAPEAFQEAKAAISASEWVKAGSLLAGLLRLPPAVFPQENRLAATAALATCYVQIKDLEGAAKVFKQRAALVVSESDKKRLLATAEALQEAQTPLGVDPAWQFVQSYDDAIAAAMKWKADQLLAKAKEIGEKAQGLNNWLTMKRVADKALAQLAEADLYSPGFSVLHKEEVLAALADNAIAGAEKAVKICTEERKFNVTPYYINSAASLQHARLYNEYAVRYLERRKAAEDALKNLERLAQEYEVPPLYQKRTEKIKALLAQLDELRYHEMVKGMPRKLRIMPRHLGTQFP